MEQQPSPKTPIAIGPMTPEQAEAALSQLAALLIDAVDSGASIGFLPPLAPAEADDYWRGAIDEMRQGSRILLAARRGMRVLGIVQLALTTRPNGLHRAEVQKLIVHTHARRQGLGRALMAAVEEAARAAGCTLLVLDTRRGDAAEQLYLACGYTAAGIIPQYARSAEGTLDDTVVFYRLLNESSS